MIEHSVIVDHGEKITSGCKSPACIPVIAGIFLRSGEDGQSFHKQGVDDALLIVQRDGDHDPRFKAPAGTAHANPPLLA